MNDNNHLQKTGPSHDDEDGRTPAQDISPASRGFFASVTLLGTRAVPCRAAGNPDDSASWRRGYWLIESPSESRLLSQVRALSWCQLHRQVPPAFYRQQTDRRNVSVLFPRRSHPYHLKK